MTLKVIQDEKISLNNIITTRTRVFDARQLERFSLQCIVDVNVPAAVVAANTTVDITANTIAATNDLTTGTKLQVTTNGGLPAGISALTDYFAIQTSTAVFQLATTLNNALAGTAIDITSQGTGTHTYTPVALAGATVKLQKSNKPEVLESGYIYVSGDWQDVAAATSITVDATVFFEVGEPAYRAFNLHYTLTAGRMSTDNYIYSKAF